MEFFVDTADSVTTRLGPRLLDLEKQAAE